MCCSWRAGGPVSRVSFAGHPQGGWEGGTVARMRLVIQKLGTRFSLVGVHVGGFECGHRGDGVRGERELPRPELTDSRDLPPTRAPIFDTRISGLESRVSDVAFRRRARCENPETRAIQASSPSTLVSTTLTFPTALKKSKSAYCRRGRDLERGELLVRMRLRRAAISLTRISVRFQPDSNFGSFKRLTRVL